MPFRSLKGAEVGCARKINGLNTEIVMGLYSLPIWKGVSGYSGWMVVMPLVTRENTCGSPLALIKACIMIFPLAPGRFSTTMGWPHTLETSLAWLRKKRSPPGEPGENGITSVRGLDGKLCACAVPAGRKALAATAPIT